MDFIPTWHIECTTKRFHQGFITKFKGQIGPKLAPNGQYFAYFEARGLWNPLNVHEIIDTDQFTPNHFIITLNWCTRDLQLGQKWSKMSKIAQKWLKWPLKHNYFNKQGQICHILECFWCTFMKVTVMYHFCSLQSVLGKNKVWKVQNLPFFGQKYQNSPTLSVWYVPQKIFRP